MDSDSCEETDTVFVVGSGSHQANHSPLNTNSGVVLIALPLELTALLRF